MRETTAVKFEDPEEGTNREENNSEKERHIPKLKLIGLGTMQEAKNKDVRKLHF